MSTELITKRAEILQGIISRMAQNSFTGVTPVSWISRTLCGVPRAK
ncbi:hypothetical protein SAMN05443572_105207 [Myxococcus fulvus]|uniref:Uncharacterized protein n=1 Tax=Myxococcus fulvus TaxID=33 RepID=A0ABY1CK71_MYXFU|nr:hypothetical protein SAMN05443572_105207 [Myxococcus fulvus]